MARHFTRDEVARRLSYDVLVPAMERALADLSAGKAVQPVRTTIQVPGREGYLFVMPAYADGALGAKLVSYFPKNVGIESHFASIQLFDPASGEPVATMDGTLITEMRTAAVSAVATERLARKDARVLAIVGAGVQARSHLAALRSVRAFDEIRVWSPRSGAAFAAAHGVTAYASAEACVRDADVIVVATTSSTPVLHGAWVKDGAHVNSVGAPLPGARELDDAFVRRATVFVDSRAGAEIESGDVIAAGRIEAELGEVVLGRHTGRSSDTEVTWFKSLGMAVEDVVSARLVLEAPAS
ncbi:MAG: ornithine cyclodeaminase family protein [Gemmatimonadetes bacterium]|nr:ornithine cyclodeaminase family protein [Gemmatimonadota bacterium]